MLVSLTMPRSITHTRSAAPYFSSIILRICSTVVTSALLPENTSQESGSPSGVQTSPMHTCLQSGGLSREQPREAFGFFPAWPSKNVLVTS